MAKAENRPVSKYTLLEIVDPVIAEMPGGPVQEALISSFNEQRGSLDAIEDCFVRLVSKRHSPEQLKYFFHSWSKTNHSAASVSGLANRITLIARKRDDIAEQAGYYHACDSLQRVTDEDLGARGGILHADLYYRMATLLCGDDSWLMKSYCLNEAQEFRNWVDQQRLREKDIVRGLLTTLVHEVYTHGEVELIHPLFDAWFRTRLAIPSEEVRKVLAWVTVHTGGTESDHFRHATEALRHYCDVSGTSVDPPTAKELFKGYLRRKAAVMEALTPILH